MTLPGLQDVLAAARHATRRERLGTVRAVRGAVVEVAGTTAALGESCEIRTATSKLRAEVVGFDDDRLLVLPIGDCSGVAPGDFVHCDGGALRLRVSSALLGRVIDGLGRPLDGLGALRGRERPLTASAVSPLERLPIRTPIETGVAAIDGFLTIGLGQRVGIFAGSGVGKSTLLGNIARGSSADVNVIALVGERGREVREFIDDVLGPEGLARSVLVVATSDQPALVRSKATLAALTIAEAFRDDGNQVLFVMDSVTRHAAAMREIGLAAGEPPTLRGYPPSLWAELPKIVERLGTSERGSITGLFTVLVEGDDLNEPVADTMRGLLDGHIVLDRRLADRGAYPAIQVLSSISRLMPKLIGQEDLAAAQKLRSLLATYEENRELIQVGAYQVGSDPAIDSAIRVMPRFDSIVYHGSEARTAVETRELMRAAISSEVPA